jgi:hypothetical protein
VEVARGDGALALGMEDDANHPLLITYPLSTQIQPFVISQKSLVHYYGVDLTICNVRAISTDFAGFMNFKDYWKLEIGN